jgi:hypothetical protein
MRVLSHSGLAGEVVGDFAKARGNIVRVGVPVRLHRHDRWHVTVNLGPHPLIVSGLETVKLPPGGCVEVAAAEVHSLEAFGGDTEYLCIGPKDF